MKDNNEKVTKDSYEIKRKYIIGTMQPSEKIGRIEFNKFDKIQSMKNLKEQLKNYLTEHGKSDNTSYVELYETFPFDGHNLTNKQKGDRVRSIWKRIRKSNEYILNTDFCNHTLEKQNAHHNFPTITVDLLKENYVSDTSGIMKIGDIIEDQQMGTTNVPDMSLDINELQIKKPIITGHYLILGCVHAPFVNKPFWDSLCKFAKENKDQIKGLILNGDFLDLNALSSHDKGRMPLEGWDLGAEYAESRKLLRELLNSLNSNIYKAFLYGNHEDRYKRYLTYPDGQKLKGAIPSPQEGLGLDHTWNIFTDWKNDEIQLGDLTIIHGEFFNVHLCKKYLDTFKKNMLFAHSHRQQFYREGEHVSYNIGCMLDFNSPAFNYASKAMKKSWANGFALAKLNDNKTTVELITWHKDYFNYGFKTY